MAAVYPDLLALERSGLVAVRVEHNGTPRNGRPRRVCTLTERGVALALAERDRVARLWGLRAEDTAIAWERVAKTPRKSDRDAPEDRSGT